MKQRMFRRRSFFERSTIGTTDTNLVLFNAPGSCTIRRIIGYIMIENSNLGTTTVNGSIEIAPNGSVTNSAFSGTALDSDVNENYMGGFLIGAGQSSSGENRTQIIQWETKGMRKLRSGDDLIISFSGSTAVGTLSGYFDIFVSE
jgi:hypothetical protein